jgi:hypothetical protein
MFVCLVSLPFDVSSWTALTESGAVQSLYTDLLSASMTMDLSHLKRSVRSEHVAPEVSGSVVVKLYQEQNKNTSLANRPPITQYTHSVCTPFLPV